VSPLSSRYSVHQNIGNHGPWFEVGNDKRSRAAVSRLVRKEYSSIMYLETEGKKAGDCM
jgi:hypothetical protein